MGIRTGSARLRSRSGAVRRLVRRRAYDVKKGVVILTARGEHDGAPSRRAVERRLGHPRRRPMSHPDPGPAPGLRSRGGGGRARHRRRVPVLNMLGLTGPWFGMTPFPSICLSRSSPRSSRDPSRAPRRPPRSRSARGECRSSILNGSDGALPTPEAAAAAALEVTYQTDVRIVTLSPQPGSGDVVTSIDGVALEDPPRGHARTRREGIHPDGRDLLGDRTRTDRQTARD